MKADRFVEAFTCMLVLATSTSFAAVETVPGAWTDPMGDVTLPNADVISGSATVSGGMVDLRVQMAAPPFPTTATHQIVWCLDTDRSVATGDACGASTFLGADEGFSLDGGLGALSTCDFVIGGNGLELDPVAHLWFAPTTNTLRLLFPLSLISEGGAFNYAVESEFGGSFGANDRAPDAVDFESPGRFFTGDVGESAPFRGFRWCDRRPITIDIQPGSFPNDINPRSHGVTPVAILTTGAFDATTVDPTLVFFGVQGTEAAPTHAALQDVDGDGDADLILQFDTSETGIECGDSVATVVGGTFGGQGLQGSDSVRTVGCP